jgi:hypothetical protein
MAVVKDSSLGEYFGAEDATPTVKQGPDGNWYQWDGTAWVPAPGMPSASAEAANPNMKQGSDGNWYQWTGSEWVLAPGMPSTSTKEQERYLTSRVSLSPPGESPEPIYGDVKTPVTATKMIGNKEWGLVDRGDGVGQQWEILTDFSTPSAMTRSASPAAGSYLTEYQKAMLAKDDRDYAYQLEQDKYNREQDSITNSRQLRDMLLGNATSMATMYQNAWANALPYAARPGQTHHMGFEPNGPYQQLVGMSGAKYDPNQYQISQQQFDPAAAWRAALGMAQG